MEKQPDNLELIKIKLAMAMRLLTVEGIMDFNGHMSYRIPGTDRVLINSRRASRAALRPQDIVTMDLAGKLVEGEFEPPSEKWIHTQVLSARPNIACVAHIHPRVSTVFSIADRPLVPVFTSGVIFPREGVRVLDDPGLIHTPAQGDAIARTLGSDRAMLMRGHGAVVVGEDVTSCFTACVWLEENAKKQLYASILGSPRVFSEEEYKRVLPQMWKESVIRKTWDYYIERGRALGVLDLNGTNV